jgi:23S rRNA (pseudouridine1915-N3)-methyltransferase
MDIAILAVGKLRSYYREACDEYIRRLRRYATIDEKEIREARNNTAAESERDEARRMEEKLPGRALLVALTREGSGWTSIELASQLERWMISGRPVAFLIGGSTGLEPGLVDRSDHGWSLGPLTLPHELARVVVCEQIYRAFTILRGEPYHKGRVKGDR